MPALKQARHVQPLSPRLSVYRWPLTMVASLAHRASGILLALFVPVYLYLISGLVGTPDDFAAMVLWMHSYFGKLTLWLTGTALLYHLVNGVRFILLDAGCFESRDGMRASARFSVAAGVLGGLLLAVFLW